MDKKLFFIVAIVILLVSSLCIRGFQKKLYNTYTNRNNITDASDQIAGSYNIEDESIKFVYKFLENWQNNLTLDYLDENVYNMYSGDLRYKLVDYIKNMEVVDKEKNEVVLVKSGVSFDTITKRQYVNLTLYITEKRYGFTSSIATTVMGNSPDSNKKFTILVYSDVPYNFKIKLFVENNFPNDNGRS